MNRLETVRRHLESSSSESCVVGSEVAHAGSKKAVRVLVTGAAGQLAYSLIFNIAAGLMFGSSQRVILHLLDIAAAASGLEAVSMELQDGAYPLVEAVVATVNIDEAFRGIDYACLVGASPRTQGMERKDLLARNAAIFREQGEALGRLANPGVKIVVVGNPANTNALVTLKYASPAVKPHQISALTRLDQNRAVGLAASRLGVPVSSVRNIVIWGNHSNTLVPDTARMESRGVRASFPEEYLRAEFIPTVQQRGAAVIKARKASSAASAARAVCEHMRAWVLGTAPGEIVSMGVVSDGSRYQIPKGVVYSFPVTCSRGAYQIVPDFPISPFIRDRMDVTLKELIEERDLALSILSQ